MDPEEDEEREYTREDYEADEADRKIKMMKEDGTYRAWRNSHLSHAEFQRRQLEDEYERQAAKAGAAMAQMAAELRGGITDVELTIALAEEWCNGCQMPRRFWGPVCVGMTQGDMTHYHSPEFWRAKVGA